MNAHDEWQWWTDALAGRHAPIDPNEPATGYFRMRLRRGRTDAFRFATVAYWRTDGKLRCHLDGVEIGEDRAVEIWPWASKTPIAHEVYVAVRRGAPWPDLHDGASRDRANSQGAPDDSSFEALKDRIDDLVRDAGQLIEAGAAKSQEEADRASDLANRLGELRNKADDGRKEEKRPHDDAAAAVQAKWLPIVGAAEIYKRIKAAVITPFLVAEETKRRAEALGAAKAAEQAAREGAPIAPPSAPERAGVKAGSSGRRSVALRTIRTIEITDRAAVLAFFADNQQITDLLHSLAEKAVRVGVDVPGVKVSDKQVAA